MAAVQLLPHGADGAVRLSRLAGVRQGKDFGPSCRLHARSVHFRLVVRGQRPGQGARRCLPGPHEVGRRENCRHRCTEGARLRCQLHRICSGISVQLAAQLVLAPDQHHAPAGVDIAGLVGRLACSLALGRRLAAIVRLRLSLSRAHHRAVYTPASASIIFARRS